MRCAHEGVFAPDIENGNDLQHGEVVVIIFGRSGKRWEFCERCLNEVFDWCDAHPEFEPVGVQYLSGWIERTLGLLPAPPTEGP